MHMCDFMLQLSLVALSVFQILFKTGLWWMYHKMVRFGNNRAFLECTAIGSILYTPFKIISNYNIAFNEVETVRLWLLQAKEVQILVQVVKEHLQINKSCGFSTTCSKGTLFLIEETHKWNVFISVSTYTALEPT